MEIVSRFMPWRRLPLGIAMLGNSMCMVYLQHLGHHIHNAVFAFARQSSGQSRVTALRTCYHLLQHRIRIPTRHACVAVDDTCFVRTSIRVHPDIRHRDLPALLRLEAPALFPWPLSETCLDFVMRSPIAPDSGMREVEVVGASEAAMLSLWQDMRKAGLKPLAAEPRAVACARLAEGESCHIPERLTVAGSMQSTLKMMPFLFPDWMSVCRMAVGAALRGYFEWKHNGIC